MEVVKLNTVVLCVNSYKTTSRCSLVEGKYLVGNYVRDDIHQSKRNLLSLTSVDVSVYLGKPEQ